RGVPLEYVAYEFDPAPAEVLRAVAEGNEGAKHAAWLALLDGWGQQATLHLEAEHVRLTVHFQDVLTADLPPAWASALYLDGFSPDRNPEVWTPELAARLAKALAPGGVLSTYSAAGRVRRALAGAGLSVEKRAGPKGKREHLRAVREKDESSLSGQ
ncbi:MAG: hypothetical protein JWQ08_2138, partial [Deinococcus sp.]|nr:hypothetical protein [Deinococcus sp.]